MAEDNPSIVKQSNNNEPTAGFNVHPENINRNGRPPKGQSMTDIMREILEEELPSGKQRKEALVRKVLELAYEGNETMVKLAWNYLDGMPIQKNVLGSDGTLEGLVVIKNDNSSKSVADPSN